MAVVLTCLSVDTDFYHQSITNYFADRRREREGLGERAGVADNSLHLERVYKDRSKHTSGASSGGQLAALGFSSVHSGRLKSCSVLLSPQLLKNACPDAKQTCKALCLYQFICI